ncbi:BTAD domain-containing putative transcriptional regulator [Thermopolyspora sp. NPDC052614]|uniref:AfsR/SARP family transcriptional regulator n=1 Tax=Thermopolyspora sp. NPDC052614 TaxID=3155682 RepID=UPI0034257E9A
MSATRTDLHFSVLGPLAVTRDGERVDLGGKRPKALLATLLIAQGKMVTVDRIIDSLWGERAPESALGSMHAYITKLRRVLEPDRRPRTPHGVLDRQGPGYVLRIAPETVDAERFTALAERGARLLGEDPFAAGESLSAALALWRGPAYADLADSEFATAEIARLEGARLTARQDHAAARLAVGAAAEAVGDLEFLVREHPLAERSWELLVLALYRCGRQGDALAALRTARERLADELGVDPGPALRAMESAVLRQDPALDWHAPSHEASAGRPPAYSVAPAAPGPGGPQAQPPGPADVSADGGMPGAASEGVGSATGHTAPSSTPGHASASTPDAAAGHAPGTSLAAGVAAGAAQGDGPDVTPGAAPRPGSDAEAGVGPDGGPYGGPDRGPSGSSGAAFVGPGAPAESGVRPGGDPTADPAAVPAGDSAGGAGDSAGRAGDSADGSPSAGGAARRTLAADADGTRSIAAASPTPRLPIPLTRLIGREEEVAAISRLLAAHRLVTITGPGGVGKSRTALEVGRRREGGEGPWLALLAELTDPALLADVVGAAMGAPLAGDTDGLAAVIGDRDALLILDNCEHLVDAAAALAESLLSRCPNLRLLATSRETLTIPGEVTFEARPLDPAGAAAELFIERAAAIRPAWSPRGIERELIARICRELDGVPLAIELAAAQTRVLSLEQVAEGLQDRFALLASGSRTAPERHRSLEAVIESSVALLSPQQRRLFARLAVFEGSFDVEGAQWLCGSRPVLPALTALVTKSLVAVEETGGGPRRYRMLETLRQYGERSLADEERRRWADRHLEWMVRLAETAERRLRSFDGDQWMRRLGHEQANIRVALAHAFATGAADPALRLASALSWYWYRAGFVHEGIEWLTRALDGAPGDHPSHGHALVGRALLRYLAGDPFGGNDDVMAAIAQAERGGDVEVLSRALPYRAFFLQLTGDPEQADRVLRDALRQVEASGLPWLECELLMVRGQISRVAGDPELAIAQLVQAADIAEACGHDWAHISCLWIAAKAAIDLGWVDRAVQQAARLVVRLDGGEDITGWLACAHVLAGALGLAGRAMEGAVLLGAVGAIGARIGYSPTAMDPLDGPRNVAAVRSRLAPETCEEAMAMGASLSKEDVTAKARDLIESVPGDGGGVIVLRADHR